MVKQSKITHNMKLPIQYGLFVQKGTGRIAIRKLPKTLPARTKIMNDNNEILMVVSDNPYMDENKPQQFSSDQLKQVLGAIGNIALYSDTDSSYIIHNN